VKLRIRAKFDFCFKADIVKLMAHEWKHYLDFKKGILMKKGYRREYYARKYADKVMEKFLAHLYSKYSN